MSVKVKPRGKSWQVVAWFKGERERLTFQDRPSAVKFRDEIGKKRLDGLNPVEAIRRSKTETPAPIVAPCESLQVEMEAYLTGRLGVRESTIIQHRRTLRTHLYPGLGATLAHAVTTDDLASVIQAAMDKGRSLSTIRHLIDPISGLYKHLVYRKKKIAKEHSPLIGLKDAIGKLPKRRKRNEAEENVWSQDETRTLLRVTKARFPAWYVFLLTLFSTGLRVSEGMALTLTDLDFGGRWIRVRRTWSPAAGKFELPKDHETREVPMTAALAEALKQHIAEKDLGRGDALLFANRRGKVFHYSFFNRDVWHQIVKASGLRNDRTPHSTRHSYATHLLDAGEDVRVVAQYLGHADPSLTMKIYAHVINRRRRSTAVNVLDQLVEVS